jgi:hypothetical protein
MEELDKFCSYTQSASTNNPEGHLNTSCKQKNCFELFSH